MANEKLIMGKAHIPSDNIIGPGPEGLPKGPPIGYSPLKTVSKEIGQIAKSLLSHNFGTIIPFSIDGIKYIARLEPHYHPPGYKAGPNGWHKGVTVYEQARTSLTEPKPSRPAPNKINNQELYNKIDDFLDKFDKL